MSESIHSTRKSPPGLCRDDSHQPVQTYRWTSGDTPGAITSALPFAGRESGGPSIARTCAGAEPSARSRSVSPGWQSAVASQRPSSESQEALYATPGGSHARSHRPHSPLICSPSRRPLQLTTGQPEVVATPHSGQGTCPVGLTPHRQAHPAQPWTRSSPGLSGPARLNTHSGWGCRLPRCRLPHHPALVARMPHASWPLWVLCPNLDNSRVDGSVVGLVKLVSEAMRLRIASRPGWFGGRRAEVLSQNVGQQ